MFSFAKKVEQWAPGRLVAALIGLVTVLCVPTTAMAYIGESFLLLPEHEGQWEGEEHKGWIRAEASEWVGRLPVMVSGKTDILAGDKLYFGGPNAPKPGRGGGKIILSLRRGSPDALHLMEICQNKAVIPEMTYAESSDLARPLMELGPRPEEYPDWWRYRLKNLRITACPVLDGAANQAFEFRFKDIEWLDYDPERPMGNKLEVKPSDIPGVQPATPTRRKAVKSYLVTWFAPATTTEDEQCPEFNSKPSEEDVLRYLTPEEAAKVKKRFGEKGVSYGGDSERRGPNRISVANFPGIVPDPGLKEPVTSVALGLNLDGDDGSGPPPPGIRKHGNFTSPDGRTGIDNQLLRVNGCVTGLRGRKGYGNQTPNARRADGNITTLIEVSDIDDAQNDKRVWVSVIHSRDKPIKDNSGKTFIPGYAFRPSDDPNFSLYNARVRGQIVDGVVTSDVIPLLKINPGQGPEFSLHEARFRVEPQADGSAKILLGGYLEWKRRAISSGYSEGLFNYDGTAVYYAYKRHADGLQNPISGEFEGISAAYEIDTVEAFLTAAQPE